MSTKKDKKDKGTVLLSKSDTGTVPVSLRFVQ